MSINPLFKASVCPEGCLVHWSESSSNLKIFFCPVHVQWQNSIRRIQNQTWQCWEWPSCHILSIFSFPVTVSIAILGQWDFQFAYHLKVNMCWLVLKFEYSLVNWNNFEEKYLLSQFLKNKILKESKANKQKKIKIKTPKIYAAKIQYENGKELTQILLANNSKQTSEKC